MSGVFAAAGAALSPSVRTAATREVADALDNMSITSATDTAAASLPEGGSVGAARISEATLEDLTPAAGGPVGKLARKAGSYLTPFTRLMESPSKTSAVRRWSWQRITTHCRVMPAALRHPSRQKPAFAGGVVKRPPSW
jgi:hypothetical protein